MPKKITFLLPLVLLTLFVALSWAQADSKFSYNRGDNADDNDNPNERVKRDYYTNRKKPSRPTPLSTGHFRCDFVGNLAIKDQCVRHLVCSKLGMSPVPTPCPGGKFFDHLKRSCVSKTEANCRTSTICPKSGIKYPDENNKFGNSYLVCVEGVPYPKKCPAGEKYDDEKKDCFSPSRYIPPENDQLDQQQNF